MFLSERIARGNQQYGSEVFSTVSVQGIEVVIESPKNSLRHGESWIQKMANDYGYIKGTMGSDGDELDVFLGDHRDSRLVFIIEQVFSDGSFDEHKIMLGFLNMNDALAAYHNNYPDDWTGFKHIREVGIEEFRILMQDSSRWKREGGERWKP